MKKLLFSASFLTVMVMVLNLLFKIYLSYHISKEELGVFYTFIDFVSIGIMLFAGFKDSLVKAYDEADFEMVFYWYIRVFLLLFFLILTIETLYYYFYFNRYFSPYILIILFSFNALMIFFSYLNSAYKIYRVMLFENLILAISYIIFFVILVNFLTPLKALIFSLMLSYLVRTLYIFIFSSIKFDAKEVSYKKQISFLKNTLLSSLMYFFSGLFISSSSIVLLNLFKDELFLGNFQVVIKSIFFSLVAVFVFPIASFTFPELSKFISQKNYFEVERLESKLFKYLIFFFFLLLLSTLFTKWAIGLVFPDDYISSYKMLNIMLPTLPFIAYTSFAINIIKAFNRFDLALYVRVLGTVIFFLSVYIFYLFDFDSKTVIYALDISFLSMFLLSFYYKKKLLNQKKLLNKKG